MKTPYKISFDSVSKTFSRSSEQDVEAIRNLSFEVRPAEFVSLVGPSGCGKTTVLNLIAGFVQPSGGEVRVNNSDPSKVQEFGLVFQGDAAFPWMTVMENIGYAFGIRRSSWTLSKMKATWRFITGDYTENSTHSVVQHYVQAVGLEGFENKFPRELSGGMRKRLELARAYAGEPEILLFDEPFGSLDVLTKQDMQELLSSIWERDKKTVLFVTHDLEEALFLSNRVLVLSPRPGTITHVFDVPFPAPRVQSLKLTEPFLELRREVTACLDRNSVIGSKQ